MASVELPAGVWSKIFLLLPDLHLCYRLRRKTFLEFSRSDPTATSDLAIQMEDTVMLIMMLREGVTPPSIILYFSERGCEQGMRFAREHGCPWHPVATIVAAGSGHLKCLKFAHEHGCPWHPETTLAVAGIGSLGGRKYAGVLQKKSWKLEKRILFFVKAGRLRGPARDEHLECLMYAHEHGCPWHEHTSIVAAATGHLDCLRYGCEHVLSHDPYFHQDPHLHRAMGWRYARPPRRHLWHPQTSLGGAMGGHLDCLMYTHEHGCPLHEETARFAAREGHLHCLTFVHKQGAVLSWEVSHAAAEGGHVDCLKYAHKQAGQPLAAAMKTAAWKGHLDCLKYAHEQGCSLVSGLQFGAAQGGHLDCLRYAHVQGCPWHTDTTLAAARGGHLDCLCYAHEQGCPWHTDTTLAAARGGHLDCLRYAHEQGCPWHTDTTLAAAQGGHLDCLRYAHEQGCPWAPNTTSRATKQCLRYAHENGFTAKPGYEKPHSWMSNRMLTHREFADVDLHTHICDVRISRVSEMEERFGCIEHR